MSAKGQTAPYINPLSLGFPILLLLESILGEAANLRFRAFRTPKYSTIHKYVKHVWRKLRATSNGGPHMGKVGKY